MPASPAQVRQCSTCGTTLAMNGACLVCLMRVVVDASVEELGTRLFGDYEVARRKDGAAWELGRGAMGITYRAQDRILNRAVALKVVETPESNGAGQRVRDRFLREARATASFRHPNVASVFHFGASAEGDRYYYAMELVEGETLEALVRRDGPLDVKAALDMAIQVTCALVAAARQGLIHRDLKPGNIMVTHNEAGLMEVKVIDFGLAKNIAAGGDDKDLTQEGGFLGTPAFASPEQFAGAPADARSDIYSLGVTLWYALTGDVPFQGKTIEEIRQAQQGWGLPIENLIARKIPRPVIQLLRNTLCANPSQRPSSAPQMMDGLELCRARLGYLRPHPTGRWSRKRKLAALAALLAIGAAATFAFRTWRTEQQLPIPPPGKSVAILPFKPLSPQNGDEILEAGMAATLIAKLSTAREIIIPSLTSATRYAEQVGDPVAAGRLLHVRLVLEGTLQRVGDRIRVTARLLNVSDGTSLWTGTFDENFTNVFAVQDAIAQKVTAALALHLTGPEQARLTKRYTENTEAYQLYFKGRFYWNKYTEESFRKSIEYFEQALEKDPAYALAYAGLADSYSLLGAIGFSEPERDTPWQAVPSEVFPKARAYAEKALQLDDTLAEAHLSLGIVKLFYEVDPQGAERELRRAKELNPNNPQVYHFYGHYLQLRERFHEAVDEMKQGARLDPTNLIVGLEVGMAYCLDQRYDEGIAQLRKALELQPSFSEGRRMIAMAYIWHERYREARAELDQVQDTTSQAFRATCAFVDAKTGKRAEAQKVLEELIRESADPRAIAWVHLALGNNDRAFAALASLEQLNPAVSPWVKMDPGFKPVVADPRFIEVLRRMGFE